MGKMIKTKASCIMILSFLLLNTSLLRGQAREGGSVSPSNGSNPGLFSNFDVSRLVIGGGLGAAFGDITIVNVSPNVGYLFTDNWLSGITTRYIYYEDKRFRPIFNTISYGGGVFSQYFLFENFIAHTEYELLNTESFQEFDKRENIHSFFVGGGYRSMIGDVSFGSILILYNLNDDINSPYPNPIIRVSLGIGL